MAHFYVKDKIPGGSPTSAGAGKKTCLGKRDSHLPKREKLAIVGMGSRAEIPSGGKENP